MSESGLSYQSILRSAVSVERNFTRGALGRSNAVKNAAARLPGASIFYADWLLRRVSDLGETASQTRTLASLIKAHTANVVKTAALRHVYPEPFICPDILNQKPS